MSAIGILRNSATDSEPASGASRAQVASAEKLDSFMEFVKSKMKSRPSQKSQSKTKAGAAAVSTGTPNAIKPPKKRKRN